MAWWTNPNIQIKQKNRFIMSIGEFLIPTVVSVDKPSVQIDSKEFTMINHVYRYPGIAKWQPITVTFVDGSGNSNYIQNTNKESFAIPIPNIDSLDAAQMLYRILEGSGYHSGKSVYVTTSKSGMGNSSLMNSVRIEQLEPDGDTVSEGWKLHNPIFTDIKWGSLSYSDEGAVEYTITIAYDWAEFYIGEQGKGINASKGNYSIPQNQSLRKKTSEELIQESQEQLARTAAAFGQTREGLNKELENLETNVQMGAIPENPFSGRVIDGIKDPQTRTI